MKTKSIKTLLQRWAAAVAGRDLPQPPAYEGPDVEIGGFIEYSGAVEPGHCFVARVRTTSDGHPYIGQALERGAALVLGQRDAAELDVDLGQTPYLQVKDSALTLAWLSAAWHNFPGRQLVIIGVTGTDGKTTTANLIFHVLRAAGLRAGMLSTLKAVLGDREEPLALHVTTPEAPVIQAYLRQMVELGLTHCVLEATSHGLAQHRVAAVDFDVAVVTNITHEHLDYHGSYEGYFAAKARLFQALNRQPLNLPGLNPAKEQLLKTAVLNQDDGSYEGLQALPAAHRLSYGMKKGADVSAAAVEYDAQKTRFHLKLPHGREAAVRANLVGSFNLYNMLAAAAAGQALELEAADIARGLGETPVLTGRMERVDAGQEFLVIVDFAHTPNGLEKAIGAARTMTRGRIITVFGSAGKRDVAKRHMMSEISAREADLTVLTAEDPRTESLEGILVMMAEGCRRQGGVEGETFWRVPDRGRAIYHALSLARPEDLVLICGKAHEQSMCFGTIEYPWDDIQATRTAIQAFLEDRPMPDLGLPTYM